MSEIILKISGLKTYFYTEAGVARAVDGVDLEIRKGETVGLVGESGCGKSTLALSILRLIPKPGRIVDGEILFKNENLLEKSHEDMRKIRGGKIAIIFQDPTNSLNPVFTIGSQIAEAITEHRFKEKTKVERETIEALRMVRIPDPSTAVKRYPHEYSGGMKQRAMIAMMLSCFPDLLIADEPTSNLDVTIQAQILQLMKDLKEKFGTAILLITHDIGVAAEMCDRIAVMYSGKIIEYSDVIKIFRNPLHPYTRALLRSTPRIDVKQERLEGIPGTVPSCIKPPPGCRFHPRCRYAAEICSKKEPKMTEIEEGHLVSCLRIHELINEGVMMNAQSNMRDKKS